MRVRPASRRDDLADQVTPAVNGECFDAILHLCTLLLADGGELAALGLLESGDMQAEEQRQRESKHQAALKESEDELAKARREWQDAIKDAAGKRAEAESQGPQRLKRPTGELPTAEGLDELISDTRRKIDVVGSFNPLAARGLGADSLSERTAKATEQVAANTKQLVREAQHGGLVFA
jgi:hypothetical protein